MKYLYWLSLVLFYVLFSACQAQKTGVSKAEDQLLYISSRGEGFDIYKNNLTGTSEVKLTENPAWDWRPQFLAAKKLIVYNSQDQDKNFRMQAMDLKGEIQAFDFKNLPEFSISPRGDWVAFTRKNGENTHIIALPLSSPKDSIQIGETGYNGRVAWANKSLSFAFISDRSGSNEIYTYRLKDGKTESLTQNESREKYLAWSPDDQKIAATFSLNEAPNEIFIIDLKTKKARQITQSSINESEIAWSGSGKYLAYHAKVAGKDDIFTLEVASGKINKITQGEGYHGEPIWIY